MPITLGTNISSLKTQRQLGKTTDQLSRVYERLASGQRINHASDDAAGLAIASQLNVNARVFTQAIRNVNDGVSAASIAEGALGALKEISQRQLELAEQAANGTYSTKQRNALNTEANTLVAEFNRITQSTTFNGLNLLDPALSQIMVQAGYGSNGALSIGMSDQLKRAVGDGTFTTSADTAGGSIYAVAAADFNGDGKIDVIVSSSATGSPTSFYQGNGDGTFRAGVTVMNNSDASYSLKFSDLNGDGKLDLISLGVDNVSVALGNGDGTFRVETTVATGGSLRMLQIADFNGDGSLDFAFTDHGSDTVNIYVGNGNGSFGARQSFSVAGGPFGLSAGDLNGDGKIDLITTCDSNGQASVLLGQGNATFVAGGSFSVGSQSFNNLLADFNNDGLLDLVAGNGPTSALMLGNSDGTFQGVRTLQFGMDVWSVGAVDLNGDGFIDLVGGSSADSAILIGNGDGTFKAARTVVGASSHSTEIGIADFNQDGAIDLLVGGGGGISYLYGAKTYTANSAYLNLNTVQGAREALNTVTSNLNRVEAQLGSIGATTSRFAAALGTLQAMHENILAAAGRIQDVDVAAESSELIRKEILQQSATAVLAQANQQPALALQLLR